MAGSMKPAAEAEIAMLPARPPQDSRVFQGTLSASGREVPAMFVQSPDAAEYLYADANLDGRFGEDEQFPLRSDREPRHETAGALKIQLKLPCGFQATTPVSVRVFARGDRWMLMNTARVLVSGSVVIDGIDTLVQYQVSCSSGSVDPQNCWLGIDSNHDGRVDSGVYSPESASAGGESVVFRAGSAFVSTESVDLRTRTVILKLHPASDYRRIELEIGNVLPDYSFVDAAGKHRRLREFLGKYVLLDFWTSWCGPCVADMPKLKEVQERFRAQGFEILGMNGDDPEGLEKARVIIRESAATWTHAIGPEATALVKKRFRIVPFPTKILVDREGRIVSIGQNGQLPLDSGNLAGTLQQLGLR